MTGDTNAPGRDSASRHRKTRRHQRFGKSAEVGETRDEAEEIDDVSSRDMEVDRLLDREAVRIANIREVRAKLSAIAYWDFPMARLGHRDFVEAVKIWTETGFDFVMSQLESIELDQNGAIRRVKIDDTAERFQFEQAKQLSDLLMGRQRNLVIEIDEQRIIAGRPKLRSNVCRCGHPREL